MWRAVASNVLTLLSFTFLTVGGVGRWAKWKYVAQVELDASRCLRERSGATFCDSEGSLAEQGAV